MEEQEQAEQQQQQHRGAGGSGGRGGAGAAAQGPHHGGCLTRNGAPPAGNPGHPRRGVAATTSAVATPASSSVSAPSQGIRGGQGRWWRGKREEGLRRLTGERLLPPPGWSAAGSCQEGAGGRRTREQRRCFPQGCGEEEAELRSVGAGGRVPSPGSGRRRCGPAGAHPTISHLAAGCPLSARRRPGRSSRTSRTGRGASRRRIPPDTLQPGRLQQGEEGAAGSV